MTTQNEKTIADAAHHLVCDAYGRRLRFISSLTRRVAPARDGARELLQASSSSRPPLKKCVHVGVLLRVDHVELLQTMPGEHLSDHVGDRILFEKAIQASAG